MVRDLKAKTLDYIFKAENITTGNLLEVFVEKFTLTAYPSHGFLSVYNILPMNISKKFPVYSNSRVTSVDWIYWRGKEDYTRSPPAPSAAGSAQCHLPAENLVRIMGTFSLTHRYFSSQHQNQRKLRQRN